MTKELVRNTGIYIVVGFSAQLLIFLLWIILVRFLAPSQIGVYALAMFVIEFFSAISMFGLDSAVTRFYYAGEKISSIFNNALVIFLASSFLALSLFFLTAKSISSIIPGLSDILEKNLFLFLAIIFVNSVINFSFVHYTALKKAILYAKFHLLRVLVFSFLSLIFIYFGFDILGVFYALLFSLLLLAILFITRERKTVSFRIVSPRIIRSMTSYGFPVMLYGVTGVVVAYFGRILLDRYTDLTTLGVYSFFLMLTLQINGLWGSFNKAWTPEIFSKFLEDKKKAMENVKFMAFFSAFAYLSAFAVFIILGELFLFRFIFKEIYLMNISVFYLLLLGPLFTGIYTTVYPLYYYKDKTRIILFISFSLSVINILLSLFLVKFFGQTGAALAFLFLSVLGHLTYLFIFRKIMDIPGEIIRWSWLLSIIMVFNAFLLWKTSSSILFLLLIIFGTFLAYKIGRLGEKKYLIFNLLRDIKRGVVFNKVI